MKLRDCDPSVFGHGLPQRLDALDLVHRLGSEIGLPAVWTRPHWNTFDHQERVAAAETARDTAQLNAGTSAGHTRLARRGRS